MTPLTTPAHTGANRLLFPHNSHRTLLWSEPVTELQGLEADIAVLGMPFGAPYSAHGYSDDQSRTPLILRDLSDRFVRHPDHYDFDIDGPLMQGRTDIRFVDCGDVLPDVLADRPGAHYARATEAMRLILKAGALPIVLGGNHGITTPMLRAYDDHGPITLIHVDAHIDWREDVVGVREGLSSPIRRASEMEHVHEIFQLGLRMQGSGRPEDVEAARKYGAHLITAYEIHDVGMQAILDRIPYGGRYYLSIDADGVDPTVMPAVAGPAPGGLDFIQMRKLIHGLVRKGRVVGMDIVEITPSKDTGSMLTCVTAGRFIVNLIGATIRAGYFDRPAGRAAG